MRRNGIWFAVVAVLVVGILLATDSLSIQFDSNEIDVSQAIEDAADDIEDATDELSEE